MRDRLKQRRERRRRSQRHPTPAEAYEALAQAQCMYAAHAVCSGPTSAVGLRGPDDTNDVLVCRAHFGRLRSVRKRDLDELERYLVRAFEEQRGLVFSG